jgi:dissimilatory sulfite reductase (desulfoviridin) alpha/beta subunit
VCKEGAVRLGQDAPQIDMGICLSCGQCIEACPTGTLVRAGEGYTVLLGGKLGRHPRLASPLPGRYTEKQVLAIVKDCIDLYKARSRNGRRFAEILEPGDIARLAGRHRGISD